MLVSTRDLFHVFGRIGLLSFGGPAAQIALMHKELVDDRNWLTEQQFLNALSFCMLLPGPEAMQLATYAGWRLRGTFGGLIAGLLFVIPGAIFILTLALGYAYFGSLPFIQALFLGVKATVLVIVLQAFLKIGNKALKTRGHWIVAALALLGIFLLNLPFPLIIIAAAVWGALRARPTEIETPLPPAHASAPLLQTITIWGVIWLTPVFVLWATGATFLTEVGLFFSKLAVVTFGGAYAVLAYMTQEVVNDYAWLTTAEMIDALGLAETTPGPLILVTEFVGLLAGFREGGIGMALAAGVLTLWVTFTPCFLWIFAGAPYIDALSRKPRLTGALHAITAAVVGVILNLSIWFALHVFFAKLNPIAFGPIAFLMPDIKSLNITALILAMIAMGALLKLKRSLPEVLAMNAILALLISLSVT
ncbi:chromate efflux transporter [Parasulfitobacter algicola]|uniref:Chromate efflux transporter n=1 Tax=Parasulfitobacter algicola TaxID=2614809 RepID=A0ABX2IU20_9RHOB|nr:chromate efflux transporter [Sulfitobacter algicola]NSX56401.1 chromate efflux transporter [Sulfitobacter algicola]